LDYIVYEFLGSGVAAICLINSALIVVNHHQFLYDWYIPGVSIIALIIFYDHEKSVENKKMEIKQKNK
jgi:hypothetical protein